MRYAPTSGRTDHREPDLLATKHFSLFEISFAVFKFAREKMLSFLSSKTMQTFLGNLSITLGFLKRYALKSADSDKFFLILVFCDMLF
jgi:uncharacterized membrane protein